ncbi:MAG: hypothetical protein WBC44_12855 [Planctomycetaceae bacterium]
MTRRELACRIADAHAADDDLVVRVLKFADGVVVLIRDREETAFRVLGECQEEADDSAIGWSTDRRLWCIVAPSQTATSAAICRLAEEFHLYDGLDSPLAKDAGIRVIDHTVDTLESFDDSI